MEPLPIDCRGLNTDQMLSLNQTCQCVSLPAQNTYELSLQHASLHGLADQLRKNSEPGTRRVSTHSASTQLPGGQLSELPLPGQSNMLAGTAVFVTHADLQEMQLQINSIEAASTLPGYRDLIRQRSKDDLHSPQPNTRGVLMGYDFHITANGPRLIEVNTNAGGAFIMHALLSSIWQSVSPCKTDTLDRPDTIERKLVAMFIHEWQLAGRSGRPATVAIVDDNPPEQFLYPDMLLAKAMLERNNINTVICSPESLEIHNGHLYSHSNKIDVVYNRTTDFQFNDAAQNILRQALAQNIAVISPAPAHHALLADKRNPAIWRNQIGTLGAGVSITDSLSRLPNTEQVTPDREANLWKRRKKLFFKPNAGYGSKATYRGDKITRKVWKHVVGGGYIAQSLEPPALRIVGEGTYSTLMKFDIRLFTYNGQRLLSAARIYRGQTTNFRTPGGGFAPVVYLE